MVVDQNYTDNQYNWVEVLVDLEVDKDLVVVEEDTVEDMANDKEDT